MSKIEVEGMHRLQGEVRIQGSKNAVLPIISACVLNEGETILHNCPKIRDVSSMLDALTIAGAKITWEKDALYINTKTMQSVPFIEKAGSMRSSVMLLGSFLGRFGKATLGYPGGCRIGKRPIDLHEQALGALGAVFCEEENYLEARCGRLEGCDIYLPFPSVGVTENVLLAAAKASGMTRIYGAAREPEIVELCKFLGVLGIRIYGAGTEKIFVMGGTTNHYAEYRICPDRIVAGTYLMAIAAAGGQAILRDTPMEHMRSTIQVLGKMGAQLYRDKNDMRICMDRRVKGIPLIKTASYPGFPTDLQSPLVAALCKADEKSCIEERVFENRFLVVKELQKMGADIEVRNQMAHITPIRKMTGKRVVVTDLRGGAALVIAALEAEGQTVLHNAEIISRGYEDIVGDLNSLGAVIW